MKKGNPLTATRETRTRETEKEANPPPPPEGKGGRRKLLRSDTECRHRWTETIDKRGLNVSGSTGTVDYTQVDNDDAAVPEDEDHMARIQ